MKCNLWAKERVMKSLTLCRIDVALRKRKQDEMNAEQKLNVN